MRGIGNTRHGLNKRNNRHPIHIAWANMKQRCLNPKSSGYSDYGGRGIKVCDRWLEFKSFYEDISPTWQEGLELDRINVNGDYEPLNCKWSTPSQNMKNTRRAKPSKYTPKIIEPQNMHDFIKSLYGRPSTIVTYNSLFKNHIEPFVITPVTEDHLTDLVKHWTREGMSARTIKQMVQLTNQYARWTGQTPLHTAPIIRKIQKSTQDTKIKSLTRQESKLLLDYLAEKHLSLYLICLFGLNAGLRRGEIFGLQYGDIDALKNRITVSRQHGGLPTKNGKTRTIPLSARLAKALELKDYLTKPQTEAIFQIFDPNADLRKICKFINIREITVHDLRHTFATLALESGVSPRLVSSWLGHSSLTTTLNIYWSVLPSDSRMEFCP